MENFSQLYSINTNNLNNTSSLELSYHDKLIYQSLFTYLYIIFSFTVCSTLTWYLDFYKEKRIIKVSKEELKRRYNNYLPRVVFNLICPTFGTIYFLYSIFGLGDYSFNIFSSIIQLNLSMYASEILFYLAHRILHMKYVYKYAHKLHHTVKDPIGISALYLDVIDLVFGNLLPIFIPAMVFINSKYVRHFYIFKVIFNTVVISHGGFIDHSDFHHIHHETFKYNFGTGLFMDRMLGTLMVVDRKEE